MYNILNHFEWRREKRERGGNFIKTQLNETYILVSFFNEKSDQLGLQPFGDFKKSLKADMFSISQTGVYEENVRPILKFF